MSKEDMLNGWICFVVMVLGRERMELIVTRRFAERRLEREKRRRLAYRTGTSKAERGDWQVCFCGEFIPYDVYVVGGGWGVLVKTGD